MARAEPNGKKRTEALKYLLTVSLHRVRSLTHSTQPHTTTTRERRKKAMKMYITDKMGLQHFRTDVTAGYASGERNNLKRHLANAQAGKYAFIDAETARMIEVVDEGEMSADEILDALLA